MPLLYSLARYLVRTGLRRGLLQGNPTWLVVLVLAGLLRLLTRPEIPRMLTEELRVGERLVIRHLPPEPRGRRRRRS